MYSIGKTIKHYREQKKLTKSALARLVGVSPSYITKLENEDKTTPSMELKLKLATTLDINVLKLFPPDERKFAYKLVSPKELSMLNVIVNTENFNNCLLKNNLSLEEISQLTDIPQKKLIDMKNNALVFLDYPLLQKLSNVLGINVNSLIINIEDQNDLINNSYTILPCIDNSENIIKKELITYLCNKQVEKRLITGMVDQIMDIIKVIIKYSPKEGE